MSAPQLEMDPAVRMLAYAAGCTLGHLDACKAPYFTDFTSTFDAHKGLTLVSAIDIPRGGNRLRAPAIEWHVIYKCMVPKCPWRLHIYLMTPSSYAKLWTRTPEQIRNAYGIRCYYTFHTGDHVHRAIEMVPDPVRFLSTLTCEVGGDSMQWPAVVLATWFTPK